jgi:hypothetical protein
MVKYPTPTPQQQHINYVPIANNDSTPVPVYVDQNGNVVHF